MSPKGCQGSSKQQKYYGVGRSNQHSTVKLDSGAVRKIYTLSGNAVNSLIDLGDEEVFIAYGVDKCSPDDFDLDLIEFRNISTEFVL